MLNRAEYIVARPPRTKPMPSFPEPARNKVHWDHLLEEMRWLAGDFVRERKFRGGGLKHTKKKKKKIRPLAFTLTPLSPLT